VKPTLFDWFIYRLFYWRWNKILATNENLLTGFRMYMNSWRGYGEDVLAPDATMERMAAHK
jgi:hypothetical protein